MQNITEDEVIRNLKASALKEPKNAENHCNLAIALAERGDQSAQVAAAVLPLRHPRADTGRLRWWGVAHDLELKHRWCMYPSVTNARVHEFPYRFEGGLVEGFGCAEVGAAWYGLLMHWEEVQFT